MKYPQVFVFFKPNSVVTEQNVRDRFEDTVDLDFCPNKTTSSPALLGRLNLAGQILNLFEYKIKMLDPCVVINTINLDEFFMMRFSGDIAGILWMKSSDDFIKIRRSITAFRNLGLIHRGLDLASKNYKQLNQILGNDCPKFKRDPSLFSDIDTYQKAMDVVATYTEFCKRLKSLARINMQSA